MNNGENWTDAELKAAELKIYAIFDKFTDGAKAPESLIREAIADKQLDENGTKQFLTEIEQRFLELFPDGKIDDPERAKRKAVAAIFPELEPLINEIEKRKGA